MRIEAQSFDVSPHLKPFVESYWYCVNEDTSSAWSSLQSCVPTGCIELILQVSPSAGIGKIGDAWTPFPDAYVVGVKREAVFWKLPAGGAYFGISLKPDGFLQLFNVPIGDVGEYHFVSFQDFFGSRLNAFTEGVRTASDNTRRIAFVEDYFADLLKRAEHHHPYLIQALQNIRRSVGAATVEDISHQVFVCQRQLQRVFREVVGVSPKLYGRIVRFNQAYQFAKEHPEATMIQVTRQFGYTDQSHFIREFREFAGSSPTTFFTNYQPVEHSPFAFTQS